MCLCMVEGSCRKGKYQKTLRGMEMEQTQEKLVSGEQNLSEMDARGVIGQALQLQSIGSISGPAEQMKNEDVAMDGNSVQLNTVRHNSIFNPETFGNRRVDVIGCGAVGSRIAMEVARLGVTTLHLWDFDTIESHNIANQLFGLDDIGRPKVEALSGAILKATGLSPCIHNQRIQDEVELGDVVFFAVDTMSARKLIFDTCIHLKMSTKIVIEVRMGEKELRVYTFDPSSRSGVSDWRGTLTDDVVTVESSCGTRTTIGSTAEITAGLAVHSLLQYYHCCVEMKDGVRPAFEQIMSLWPLMTITKGEF